MEVVMMCDMSLSDVALSLWQRRQSSAWFIRLSINTFHTTRSWSDVEHMNVLTSVWKFHKTTKFRPVDHPSAYNSAATVYVTHLYTHQMLDMTRPLVSC